MSQIKGLEQGRAQFAYNAVDECINMSDEIIKNGFEEKKKKNSSLKEEEYLNKFKKEYKSYVKKIPTYIKTNGLGACFAFVKSKAKNDNNSWQLIYSQTTDWLKTKPHLFEKNIDLKKMDLVDAIISSDSSHYRMQTVEVLALFNWLKRFADGRIEGESDE